MLVMYFVQLTACKRHEIYITHCINLYVTSRSCKCNGYRIRIPCSLRNRPLYCCICILCKERSMSTYKSPAPLTEFLSYRQVLSQLHFLINNTHPSTHEHDVVFDAWCKLDEIFNKPKDEQEDNYKDET